MVLMIARQEAGPRERRPKMLKGKLDNNSKKPRDGGKTGIVTTQKGINLLLLRVG
jgi:hypothetical protein